MAYDYNPTIAYTNVNSVTGTTLIFFSTTGFSASANNQWDPNGPTAPNLNQVQPGWYVNGNGVTNNVVLSLSGQETSFIIVTLDTGVVQPGSTYTFSQALKAATYNHTPATGPADFLSTNLNSRIKSYDMLAERIFFQLGAPVINLEIACVATYDMIAYAIELYTKFTPGTEELIVFDSNLYTAGKGIKIDSLVNNTLNPEISALDDTFQSGWDVDLNDYRKVIDVTSFNVGTNNGVNTLFTIEQSMAQQMHFAYSLGSKAFDVISWHILKDWLKTREKVFAQQPYFRFDPRTQVLRITPDPKLANKDRYWAMISCRMERPIKDLVKERWVMEYAKALVKINIANTRGKFQNTQLFGSGTLQYDTLMNQGITEKKDLEDQLMNTRQEDQEPPQFFMG